MSHTIYQLTNARPEAYVADGVVSAIDATAALIALDDLHAPGMDAVVETLQN